MREATDGMLGAFLRDCRARLDPAAFGFSATRRRTPGLRREEVAQRAHISPTWYTWLEQGRGGPPSPEVLERIATALMLTEREREHVFLLALGHPPEARFHGADEVTPRLRRVLDALGDTPAIVKTATWDVVAWNRAAAALFTDYGQLPREQRNILRLMFSSPRVRAAQDNWDSVARSVVRSFRIDAMRAGANAEIAQLVAELCAHSAEFAALWQDRGLPDERAHAKRIHHPQVGTIDLEISYFAVDGRPDLAMVVYHPVDADAAARVRALADARLKAGG
ncbi:helix-turn-helix transcriptional regulator [Stenotrophomonas sp. HITSZ_GD]|uniref:helix-turn-helix transcriptional regulator n=1 Tax=Stenotrophomonas sp. HITSZ_GD TaxID=3037248 RepID=UPI0031F2D88D